MREESLVFLLVLDAQRSQYCTINHLHEKYEKLSEIQVYICTQDRFKRVSYPRRISSLLFLCVLGKKTWEGAFAIAAEEKPSENGFVQHSDHGWDIFEREVCSSTVNSFWFISPLGSR